MIQSVEKNYMNSQFENYKVTLTDNSVLWVPHDTANRHYQEILEWVAEGNTITDNGSGE
tara:strand:+ start:2433 stop:2609 length:177 start_codon:yes stop_codon:yes gene_type:complete